MEEKNLKEYCTAMLETIFPLPDNYQVESYLGEGSYGYVIRCFRTDTQETVAVKIPPHGSNLAYELIIMALIKSRCLDNYNIIRFIEAVKMKDNRVALAFENLYMTLHDYIHSQGTLSLHDVRSVTQQMAIALYALKRAHLMHSDIKGDNIMLVAKEARPIRVKLIDFGLTIPIRAANQSRFYPVSLHRAPEMHLGAPFTEAADMWSLGLVIVVMLLGNHLILEANEYDVMQRFIELFGMLPDHILNQGLYSHKYFIKTPSGSWRFKTPVEFGRPCEKNNNRRGCRISSLDELETLPLENLEMVDADERKECIDLLKAMFRLDPSQRITAAEVLKHPFIKRGNVQCSSDNEQPGMDEPEEPGGEETTSESQTIQSDEPEDSGDDIWQYYGSLSTPSVTRLICVQSAPPDCCFGLDEDIELQNESRWNGSGGFYGPSSLTSSQRVIYVQSAPPDCCFGLDEEDEQQNESCSLTKLEEPSDDGSIEHSSEDESDCLYSLFLAKACNPELSATTSDDADTEKKRKKKKKKNCFKRFCSWIKKTFCSCIDVQDQDN